MFNGIPIAPPVQAPQAGINISPMDQVGMAFQMLPSLMTLLMGKQNQGQNQAQGGATPGATLGNPQTPVGAQPAAQTGTGLTTATPQFQAPNYAGTGYRGPSPIPAFGQGLPPVPGSGGLGQLSLPTLMQLLGQGAQSGNPYQNSNNPFARPPMGSGMGSGLMNPNSLFNPVT